MHFIGRLVGKIAINGILLYVLAKNLQGFYFSGDLKTYLIGALVITALNLILKPIIKLLTTPLRWITLGLFNIVIYIGILWLADRLLPELIVQGFLPLMVASVVIGIANTIF